MKPLARKQQQPAPIQRIAARPTRHWGDAMLCLSAGAVSAAAINFAGHPALAPLVASTGAAAGIASVVIGKRRHTRHQVEDQLLEALAPLLGLPKLDRRAITCSNWQSQSPTCISVSYTPGLREDPTWVHGLISVLEGRLLSRWRVDKHDTRKCRIRFIQEDKLPEQEDRTTKRLTKSISQLMGATARISNITFTGTELATFDVHHQDPVRFAQSGYRARIERTVSSILPGRWRATWDLEQDKASFEARPALPASVWLPVHPLEPADDLLKNYRSVAIPYGVDEDGNEVTWRPAVSPHFLITGGTGTGKTSLAHTLLQQITRNNWPVWISDAKRVEFLHYRDWPNVQIVASTVEEQNALIHRAWETMEGRYQLIEREGYRPEDFEPLVLFLDEFAEFRMNLIEWYNQIKVKGMAAKPSTLAATASLARKARTARIHIVLLTQRPDAEFLSGEMRDNFPQRASLGRLSPQGALMMWENAACGVAIPRNRVGRAMTTNTNGIPIEVQCYRAPTLDSTDEEEQTLLEALRPSELRHQRLVFIPPDIDEDNNPGSTFKGWCEANFALALEHPNLDPLNRANLGQRVDMSSPMAILNRGQDAQRPRLQAVVEAEPRPVIDDSPFAGYDEPEYLDPASLNIGDLIEIDGRWVVIDETPEPDILDDDSISVSWRSDDDESGVHILSSDESCNVRRPTTESADNDE